MNDARATEARRQQALLAALSARGPAPAGLALKEDSRRAVQGLDAYRINAAAIAHRALGAAFPTVAELIGAEDFEHLAAEYWRAEPPVRGDLGEWGGGFADWIEAHAAFTDWPYFGDCARLDLAVHRCERAADAESDTASLTRLADGDPARLRITLMPGTDLLVSRWPIATIHAAHHGADTGFDAVREAMDRGAAENALVVRAGWRASVRTVDAATARWTTALLGGASIGVALDAAGDGFDFSAWLATALQARWLKGVEPIADQPPTPAAGDPA